MKDLPPITFPEGKRTEGTLLKEPMKRITRKSKFLKNLEKQQAQKELPPVEVERVLRVIK